MSYKEDKERIYKELSGYASIWFNQLFEDEAARIAYLKEKTDDVIAGLTPNQSVKIEVIETVGANQQLRRAIVVSEHGRHDPGFGSDDKRSPEHYEKLYQQFADTLTNHSETHGRQLINDVSREITVGRLDNTIQTRGLLKSIDEEKTQ